MQAALKDDVESIIEVGRRLYDGIGVERDQPAAFEWYLKAAQDFSDSDAIENVVKMYAGGKGVAADSEKAAKIVYNKGNVLSRLRRPKKFPRGNRFIPQGGEYTGRFNF